MTADPSRLVARLTSAGGSIAVFHVQFHNLKSINKYSFRERYNLILFEYAKYGK